MENNDFFRGLYGYGKVNVADYFNASKYLSNIPDHKIPLNPLYPQCAGAFIRFVLCYICFNRSTLNF